MSGQVQETCDSGTPSLPIVLASESETEQPEPDNENRTAVPVPGVQVPGLALREIGSVLSMLF